MEVKNPGSKKTMDRLKEKRNGGAEKEETGKEAKEIGKHKERRSRGTKI